MYQKMMIPIDHGNRNMKTEHFTFTSGLVESDSRPALGEYMHYNGRYYALTEQRIPYMRDKTVDDRFFILTLFGIAMEAEKQALCQNDVILQAELPVGLPPKHYGALYKKFQEYFSKRGRQSFTYKGKAYTVEIEQVSAFPQDYAAAMTIYPKISGFNKVVTVDIGGFTLYNKVISRINSEHDMLLEDGDVDRMIREEKTDYDERIQKTVREMTKTYVDDLLGTFRERGIDLKTGCVVFIGGGALLLRKYLEHSEKIGSSVFIEDIRANAKGYGLLYQIQRKGR